MLLSPQAVEATNDDNENGEVNFPCYVVRPGDCGMRVFQPIIVNNEENPDSNDDA